MKSQEVWSWQVWLDVVAELCLLVFFFFQAEDGIRDLTVTGVQTCALPISQARLIPAASKMRRPQSPGLRSGDRFALGFIGTNNAMLHRLRPATPRMRTAGLDARDLRHALTDIGATGAAHPARRRVRGSFAALAGRAFQAPG